MSILRNKQDSDQVQTPQGEADQNVHFGVLDVFSIDDDSDDLVVMAMVQGKIRVGDTINITHPGDDDDEVKRAVIRGIEVGPERAASEASDGMMSLIIEHGESMGIRKGTVGYGQDCTTDDIRATYIAALGQTFVANDSMDISEKDVEQLSIADYEELIRLYRWYIAQHPEKHMAPEVVDEICKRHMQNIVHKILTADRIYALVNKDTGEAHMLSRTIKQEDGRYVCTPPDIMLFTRAQMKLVSTSFPEEQFEYKLIENGEERKGIHDFLADAFFLNGACGIAAPDGSFGIDQSMIVSKPDYGDMPEINILVTNPAVERWLLLMAQVGEPDTPDKELVANLYYQFFSREVLHAKFLVPMKHTGDIPKPDADGRTVIQKDTTISLAVREGKFGRSAVNMYTDWKRLRMQYDESWDGMVQPVEGFIDSMDCVINATKYYKAGCYINEEMYNAILKAGKSGK